MQSLRHRHVVVTGASSGVGRAAAVAFARLGCRVGLVARGSDGLEGARLDVEAAGGRALVLPADVADADEVEQVAERAEREGGPIDIGAHGRFDRQARTRVMAVDPETVRAIAAASAAGFVAAALCLGYARGRRAAAPLRIGRDGGRVRP